ncbi:hypothetical protein [Thiolapillus brandeum]|uniref:Copper chaperone PCu(A)C n=1 Tax=Thiolapillus brandeum TaxID=1076588 RepID=A0A7U6JHV3_9GAMM|nr:hypothetical protein [Thiolapillus brandeum]BAO44859.1 hypothetical protein TBH_C1944 [Thiolapillus brandeum]
MKTMKMIVLCLTLIPLMIHAEPTPDIPDQLAGQLSTLPAKGKIPVYAISMKIDLDGSTLNKNIGVLAGETAVLSFMDDDGPAGYEIRINTPKHANLLGDVPYGKIKVKVLDKSERKEVLAEPVLMSPLNGDKVQVELGGNEAEGLSIAMRVKQFYIDAVIADAEKK